MTKRAAHYTARIGNDICMHVALGKTLSQALAAVGYLAPTIPTFWRWIDEHEDFRDRYERARKLQADMHADRLLEMSAEVINMPSAAAAYRVASDILKWQAAIRNRRVYGDKDTEAGKNGPMDAAKIKAEIKRLETELGVAVVKQAASVKKKVV